MIETHAHFFGSLPPEFILQAISLNDDLGEFQDDWNNFFGVDHKSIELIKFISCLEDIFRGDYKENINIFFTLYTLLRHLVKRGLKNPIDTLYYGGSKAIANEALNQGLKRFSLLIGISKKLDTVIGKLESTIKAFIEMEDKFGVKPSGFIRLTFSRDQDGTIKNNGPNELLTVLDFLDKNPAFRARVEGFDFCGQENLRKLAPTLELLQILSDHNKKQEALGFEPYKISIHAGENLVDWSAADHLSAFEMLLDFDFDYIGHGTFLWLPKQLLDITASEDLHRKRLLLACGEVGRIFEICPTANILLTPMESGSDFPLDFFNDNNIVFTVNTDNPGLFLTSPQKERDRLGLGQ